ncbi:hypothetical protein WJU23_02425 [Prosthecobacter sp. SYSU 5D2]|uniref:hypothetical protein n=1 Tax=Prosthecobacter sp. SYSU 5D2 TaxID=3134134 RepID=UPI0031FEB821
MARTSLDQVLVKGKMRFFFTTEGPHAVEATDANGNGVPDQVEDIATQTQGAWLLLIDGLGFPDPFLGERFREAMFLDVHLFSKELLKSNGIAYDELQSFKRAGDPENTRSLCFNVATSVKATANLTPAHELFHIIQNGACFFKNRWYTEGTARWSEKALGTGGVGSGLRSPWPPSEDMLKKLDDLAYDAAALYWEPLALHVDARGEIPEDRVSAALREMKYVNGEPVLKDLKLHGWEVIRDILTELGEADGKAAKERGLDRWPEEEQRSSANTPYIREAVERVLAKGMKEPNDE